MKSSKSNTIDAIHNSIISNLKDENNNKGGLLKEISLEKEKCLEFKKKTKKNLSIEEIDEYLNLKDSIKLKKKKLNQIIDRKEIIDYYLDNTNILTEYYLNKKNIESNNYKTDISNNYKKNILNNLDFNKKKIINNTELLDNYLIINNKNHIKNKKKNVDTNTCQHCNIEMTIYNIESITVCPKCGKINYIILDSTKPSYKDPPPEISYFAYKRINHFNEWLCQFQGKETTDIPEEIYNKILLEIKKERITDMSLVTPIKVRQYLKKLKLNKYYEHTTHIINRLNSTTSGILNKETENKLRRMFRDIQEPFIQVCPKNRKNFLSYSYVLNKFVELLQMSELKQYFPLLKSREKLHQQDMIWKDICKILDWPYHKSI